MFKHTRHYKPLSVDMAAMCDVAFLLLTFFILTAHPKWLSPININPPSSSSTSGDLFNEPATIMVGEDKMMLAIPKDIRAQTLINIGKAYHVKFSNEEIGKFEKISVIGVPVAGLKEYINTYYHQKQFFAQQGIPVGTTDNQLAQWIKYSRISSASQMNRALPLQIQADREIMYPTIKSVIDVLQRQGISKFSMYTTQEYHYGEID